MEKAEQAEIKEGLKLASEKFKRIQQQNPVPQIANPETSALEDGEKMKEPVRTVDGKLHYDLLAFDTEGSQREMENLFCEASTNEELKSCYIPDLPYNRGIIDFTALNEFEPAQGTKVKWSGCKELYKTEGVNMREYSQI